MVGGGGNKSISMGGCKSQRITLFIIVAFVLGVISTVVFMSFFNTAESCFTSSVWFAAKLYYIIGIFPIILFYSVLMEFNINQKNVGHCIMNTEEGLL